MGLRSVLALACCCALCEGTAWYEEGTNWLTFTMAQCGEVEYNINTDGELPTCHSQLRFMLAKKTSYDPFVKGKYFGVPAPELMPIPDAWNTWEAGSTGECNQDVGEKACKRRVVCATKEWRLSTSESAVDRVYSSYGSFNSMTDNVGRETKKCTLCVPIECPDASCPNGVLVGSPIRSIDKKVYHRPTCTVACSPGTWLTCERGQTCKYQAPSTYHAGGGAEGKRAWFHRNVYETKSDLNVVEAWPLPVASCYPCNLADRQQHYGARTDTPNELFRDGFLSFRCPGGDLAPVMCPRNMVTRVDDSTGRSGDCQCMNGYYWDSANQACEVCPAGFMCRWAGMTPPAKVECPVDQYATEGRSECKKCDTAFQRCERYQALERCVPSGDGRYQRRDATCVDCAKCKQVTGEEGSVPCYKVIEAFDQSGALV